MNLSRAAAALDLNQGTLKLWIARPEFAPFFSAVARQEGLGRDLNDDDVIVANTIRKLRAGVGNSNVDWQAIADQLAGNYRDRDLPASASNVATGLTVAMQHERVATIISERDSALSRVDELKAELSELRAARIQDAERIGRAEVELELWRAGRIKPGK